MITACLFTGYALGVSAITYNITKVKLQDDFESEVRNLREYDYSNERIDPESHLITPNDCIVLLKYKPEDNEHLPKVTQKI